MTHPLRADRIQPEIGYSYVGHTGLSRFSSHLGPSPARLLENGVPLAHGNGTHDIIRREGHGWYSFWHQYVYFSTSDNSSPLKNGRTYDVQVPFELPDGVTVLLRVVTGSMWAALFVFLWPRALLLFLANLIGLGLMTLGCEYYLARVDPARNLPFNGVDDRGNQFTWGHPVTKNQFDFREREFSMPKPAGTCRIMILGDSFTWGSGLAVQERYSNRLEDRLRREFPEKKIEVLNFALSGIPTVRERDVLRDHRDRVQPNQIVVGFCLNDPQPHRQSYSLERERFYERYGNFIYMIEQEIKRVGFPRIVHVEASSDTQPSG